MTADKTTKTPVKKKAAAKQPAAAKPSKRAPAESAPMVPLTRDRMNAGLLAIHDKAQEINAARAALDVLVSESDALVQEAADEGERYRDIAAAAGRTVPWVQMSLRRVAGVSTHPAEPIPNASARIRRSRRQAS
jgi:hypothetical protein